MPAHAVRPVDPPSFQNPHPLYASYTTVPISPTASLITVAGQVAQDPATNTIPTGLAAQVDLCLSRLSMCLEHAGATKLDITRLMYYIAQPAVDELDGMEGKGAALKLIGGKVMAWQEGHRPAACFLRVQGMSDPVFLCEFECMAVVTKD
jgi:enamine deaminase RidA (YjgF/YER057c/UK114 family)